MNKIDTLGSPLGNWNVEVSRVPYSMPVNVSTSHNKESDLFKYIHAVMNSTLIQWRLQHSPSPMQDRNLELALIPKITPAEQRPFINLVDQILEANADDANADTSYLEWDIDDLVYDLYGLSEEEKTEIERNLGLIHQTEEEEGAALVRWIEDGSSGEYVSESAIMETLKNRYGN